MFLNYKDNLKDFWKVISRFFVIFGVLFLLYNLVKIYNQYAFSHICYPKQKRVLERFIKEVIESNPEMLKDKEAFLEYKKEIAKGWRTSFKSVEALLNACKADFSEKYTIIATDTSFPCDERSFYVKFENGTVYEIMVLYKIPNLLWGVCICPGYKVVYVDKELQCERED